MIPRRIQGLLNLLRLSQAFVATVLFVLCAWVTFQWLTSVSVEHLQHYPIYLLLVLIGLFVEASWRRPNMAQFDLSVHGWIAQHQITLRQVGFAFGLLLCYLALVKDHFISRSFLLVYVPVLYFGLLVSNRYLTRLLAKGVFQGMREERTLFVGAAQRVAPMRQWAREKVVLGIDVVGVLSETMNVGEEIDGLRCLGHLKDLEETIRREAVTQVIVLELPQARESHQRMVALLERLGVRLLIHNNLEELLTHPVVHLNDEGVHFITLRHEPLEDPFNRIIKRALDLAVAVPVLVLVLPPVALLVWLLQRWQSPGPLFFRQPRAGIQNLQFTILKFRTMHPGNVEEARQATPEDGRIYPAGRWLRRMSLDELPQFFNVLQGDMSVTGPRPHLIEHNAQFARQMANYHVRACVKPGITGLAQVQGFRGEVCSEEEIADRLKSDISYLENWRLALDLGIIARTAWQMIQPTRKAY